MNGTFSNQFHSCQQPLTNWLETTHFPQATSGYSVYIIVIWAALGDGGEFLLIHLILHLLYYWLFKIQTPDFSLLHSLSLRGSSFCHTLDNTFNFWWYSPIFSDWELKTLLRVKEEQHLNLVVRFMFKLNILPPQKSNKKQILKPFCPVFTVHVLPGGGLPRNHPQPVPRPNFSFLSFA